MATLADRNFNPGNLRDTQTGNFRQFPSENEGYSALMNDLQAKVNNNPNATLYDFSQKYAPASDKNDPAQYTVNLANQLGVTPTTKISELQQRIPDWAKAIAKNEGYTGGQPIQDTIVGQDNNQQNNNERQQRISQGEPVGVGIDQSSKPSFLGGLLRDAITPFARGATNIAQAGEMIGGKKITEPFSGQYLGLVPALGYDKNDKKLPFGKAVGDTLGQSVQAGLTIAGAPELKTLGEGALKGLIENVGKSTITKSLENPIVRNAVERYIPDTIKEGQSLDSLLNNKSLSYGDFFNALTKAQETASPIEKTVLQQTLDKIAPKAISEAGGKVPFSELHPNWSKVGGMIGKFIKNSIIPAGLGYDLLRKK